MSYRERLDTPDAEPVEQTETNTIAPQDKISQMGRKPPPNRLLKGRSKMSVNPTNFHPRRFDRLRLPGDIQAIPPNATDLSAY